MPKTELPRLALSVRETAEALGLSVWMVRAELRAGRLRSVLVGRRRLIPLSAIEERLKEVPND